MALKQKAEILYLPTMMLLLLSPKRLCLYIIKAVKEEQQIKDKIREGFPISEILKEHKSI
jgi:hypothetical protein